MSLAVIPVHVALVDRSGHVNLAELQQVSADLNQQIQRDFAPVWGIKASVGAYSQVPKNTWAVIIQKTLSDPSALGYHTDNGKQPVSYVEFTPDWSVTVSHETLEMLADPWGNRLHGAPLPEGVLPSQVNSTEINPRVNYLLEMCDPCEAGTYTIGETTLSDFLLPGWYYTTPMASVAFSHTGFCKDPRQVADGGYVSFMTADETWWQVFNEGGQLSLQDLGTDTSRFSSLREFTDDCARAYRASKA